MDSVDWSVDSGSGLGDVEDYEVWEIKGIVSVSSICVSIICS